MAGKADRLLAITGRQSGWWISVLALATLISAGAELLLPAALGRAIDALPGGGHLSGALLACAGLIAAMIAGKVIGDIATGASSAEGTIWLRMMLIQHLLAIGPAATRRFEPGDLVTRVTRNANEAGQIGMTAVMVGAGVIPPIGGIVALMMIDPWVGLTALAGLGAMAGL